MRAQPGVERGFSGLACGEGELDGKHLYVTGWQLCAIEFDERFTAHSRSPLVAIDERVVPCKAEGEAGCEIRQIRRRVAVCMELLGSCQGRLHQGCVAQATSAAVFCNLPIMQGERQWRIDPDDHS